MATLKLFARRDEEFLIGSELGAFEMVQAHVFIGARLIVLGDIL